MRRMPVPALALPVLLASAASLTACDFGVGYGVPGGYEHPVGGMSWRLASSPEYEGEGVDFVVGWELSYDACPSGLELAPDGESVTFGSWHTVVSAPIDTPDDFVDWDFSDHEYVAAAGRVNGESVSLVTGQVYGGIGAHLLRHVDGSREDLVFDDTIVDASLTPNGAMALTAGRRCLVHAAGGAQRLPDEACQWDHHVTGAGGLAWVGGYGGIWRVDANGPRQVDVRGSRLLWHPEAQTLVIAGATDDQGRSVILGLDREGERLWSRAGQPYANDLVALPGGVVAVADSDYMQSQVRFLDAATGAPVREPLRLPGWVSELSASEDGRRIAVLSDYRVWAFQIAE